MDPSDVKILTTFFKQYGQLAPVQHPNELEIGWADATPHGEWPLSHNVTNISLR